MSTLPGGAADKAGLIHEALWGVSAMLDVLRGQSSAICIEEPGVDGAEFYLQQGKIREYWQAKRQVLSQANWSLKLLREKGVLDFFREQAQDGNRCVFASISDAPELRVLAENASAAKTWEVFRDEFLTAKERLHNFNELRIHWNNIPEREAFRYLQIIRVESAGECTLDSQLSRVLQATFAGPPQTALSVLHHLYVSSVHQTLTSDQILKHLEKCGIKPREFQIAAKLRDFVLGITDGYIAGQRSNPFVGREGRWRERLRYLMQFGNLEKGRRFFDLFLRLLDNGTLDDARSMFAENGTFWSMLSLLPKTQPAWHAEVAAHWLGRKVNITSVARWNAFQLLDEYSL